jgi:hypothetical protein
MFFTIYKTVNIINGKYYIGKHKTSNLDDGYLGSGKILKSAITKYGEQNFHKEILHLCESEEHMNLVEKILVVPDRETNYNICDGGQGGWSYLNKNGLNNANKDWSKITPNLAKKLSRYRKNILANSVEEKQRFFEIGKKGRQKAKELYPKGTFYGKSHTEDHKQKMSLIMKEKQSGEKNSQYGTCWINKGQQNKKIKKEDLDKWLRLGYNKGRIMI